MNWIDPLCYFLGGGLLTNAIPHFVNGVSGRSFQSPFASPPGKGLSSPVVNVGWGFANAVAAWLLLFRLGAFRIEASAHAAPFALGALFTGLILAAYLGKLHDNSLSPRGGLG